MNIIIPDTNKGFWDRPDEGYTYIYAYYYDNTCLYVGQTVQAIGKRYNQHLSDWSGCRYANCVYFFQIMSSYAYGAECMIGSSSNGLCQQALPSWKNAEDIPDDIQRRLRYISNKTYDMACHPTHSCSFINKVDLSGYIEDMDDNYMDILVQTWKCKDIIYKHMPLKSGDIVNISPIRFGDIVDGVITFRNHNDHPIMFIYADNSAQIGFLKDVTANFPIYIVYPEEKYQMHEKIYNSIFQNTYAGLILKTENKDKNELIYNFGKYHCKHEEDLKVKDLLQFKHYSKCRLVCNNYNYLQIA